MRGVRKAFQALTVIEHFDLAIDAGEFLAILGPSGCGKSTLLRMIARLGAGRRLSHDSPDNRFQTAYVFQDAHLLPWRNVLDNVALPLELKASETKETHAPARTALTKRDSRSR